MIKKTFKFIVILVCLTITITIPLLYLSLIIHELGHINAAKQQGIDFKFGELKLNPFSSENKLGQGEAVPASKEDCEKFNALSLENKQRITHAGIKHLLMFYSPILIIIPILLAFYWKKLIYEKPLLFALLIMLIVIITVIFYQEIWKNVLLNNPANDWHFVNFPDCSIYSSQKP